MTKKLEDILNLPNVKEEFKEVDKKEKDKKLKETANGGTTVSAKNLDPKTQANLQKSYAEFDKIAASLPQVKGLGDMSDLEMDKLAVEAEESYKNLMDLGMNVDSRKPRKKPVAKAQAEPTGDTPASDKPAADPTVDANPSQDTTAAAE